MRLKFTVIAMVLVILFAFSACGSNSDSTDTPIVSELSYEGFTSDSISGGAELNDGNLRSLSVTELDTDTVISLDFCIGSNLTSGDNEIQLRTLPDYGIQLLDEPYRLAIRVGKLDHTDYILDEPDVQHGLVDAFFSVSGTDESYTLYFQLNNKALYSVEESEGILVVTLRPAANDEIPEETSAADDVAIDVSSADKAGFGEAYYVVANAFDMYRNGTLSCGEEMTPTLSSDLKTILLISHGQSSKSEAEALMSSLLSSCDGAVSAQWSIVKLKNGELPEYNSEMEYLAAYDVQPCRISDNEAQSAVIIPDGIALSVTPDKNSCIYSKHISEYTDSGDTIEYEQLWIHDFSGKSRAFTEYQFEQIVSASYSPDGRRLAVLEMAGESSHLYVFDVDSRDLITDLSAVGFGNTISAYCWDSLGGRLFSIGGSSEIGIHQYDFNVPDETKRHSDVDKNGCDESIIGFADGEVYFVETDMENGGTIYRIKPEGGSRREFITGDNFRISPDSRYMAYTVSGEDAAGTKEPLFAYIDIQSGEIHEITKNFSVFSFIWSLDGSKIYYFENRATGGDESEESETEVVLDEYPYTLWVYDIETAENKTIADLTSTSVISGSDANTVYICYTDKETLGDVVRATYALSIDG